MAILMVGKSDRICKILRDEFPKKRLIIFEEKKNLKKRGSELLDNTIKLYEASYENNEDYGDVLKQVIEENDIEGVIPVFESTIKTSNNIAKLLELPRIGDQGVCLVTDKYNFAKFCEEFKIPHPRSKVVNNINDIDDFTGKYPIIIKPCNGQGSVGVVKINDKRENKEKYEYCVTSFLTQRQISEFNEVKCIAQELIQGKEYSVEVFVQNGIIAFINYTKKFKFDNGFFVESGHQIESDLSEINKKKIWDYMCLLIEKAKIENSILHAEWIIESETPYIIECAGRRPGDKIPELISLGYRFSFYKEYVNLLIGEKLILPKNLSKNVKIKYFNHPKGYLKDITGIDCLCHLEEIIDWEIKVKVGDIINNIENSWDRVGYFIIQAEKLENLNLVSDKIENKLRFIVE